VVICSVWGANTDWIRNLRAPHAPRHAAGYTRDAGFDDIEVVPIELDMFCFYRLLG
jgi:hypothetical protein